jgi:hypothetical protein
VPKSQKRDVGHAAGQDGDAQDTDAGFTRIKNLHRLEVLDAIRLLLLTNDSLRSLSRLSRI